MADSKHLGTVEQLETVNSLESGREKSHGSPHEVPVLISSNDTPTGYNKVNFRFVMTMLGFSMAFIVAEVLPLFLITNFTVIAFDLGAIQKVIWVLVAPYISTGAVAPFVGSLSDLMGRKGVLLASLGISVIAMILCAAAPGFAVFLLGQVIAGIGIGMLLLTVIAAASELVPVSRRGITIGYIAMGFLPFASASLYGQLLTSSSKHGWRYIFLVIGVWAALAFIVLAVFYCPPPRPAMVRGTRREILKKIDYVGCLLSVTGVTVFLVGINWGGNDYPWNSKQVISALVVGALVLVSFVAWEIWMTKTPMFPMRLIQSKRHFIAVSLLCFTSGINYVPLTVFWTIQVYTVYQADFPHAGLYLLPLGWCIVGGAVFSAVLITVFKKRIMWVLLIFCAVQTIGMGCMSLIDPYNISTAWGPMIFGLLGVGAVLLPSQVVFSVISPDDLIGTSVALSLVIRMMGQVVGKSMFYNLFHQRVESRVLSNPEDFLLPAIEMGFLSIDTITELVTILSAGPLSHYVGLFPPINTPEKLQIIIDGGREIYKGAFPLLYKVSIPFGALACISSLMLWGIDKYIDEHVVVHL